MRMVAIDTLKLYERLRAAGVPEAQAKAQAEAFAEALGDMMAERLATKEDLAKLRAELIRWVSGLMIAQAGLIVALIRLLG